MSRNKNEAVNVGRDQKREKLLLFENLITNIFVYKKDVYFLKYNNPF